MMLQYIQDLNYLLAEQPLITSFRWSPSESWGATWLFLVTSISTYIVTAATLRILLLLFRRRHPVPLGPFPALHSLLMALLSATIFTGILLSTTAEIRDTRWFWQRSKTPFQWLLCFPLGTRPSGRVFFWSYIFYLSRFVHIFKTFFTILRNPQKFPYFQLFNHSILICMSFLWLEFSQSFQVLAILSMTLVFSLVYGYRFCIEIGLQKGYFPFVMFCQIILLVTNFGWHIGVLFLHFLKGGCNGMGAWVFNSMLNSFVLFFVLDFYVKKCLRIERDFASFEVKGKEVTSELTKRKATLFESKKMKNSSSGEKEEHGVFS